MSNKENNMGVYSVLATWVWWEYTQKGENVFAEDMRKLRLQ